MPSRSLPALHAHRRQSKASPLAPTHNTNNTTPPTQHTIKTQLRRARGAPRRRARALPARARRRQQRAAARPRARAGGARGGRRARVDGAARGAAGGRAGRRRWRRRCCRRWRRRCCRRAGGGGVIRGCAALPPVPLPFPWRRGARSLFLGAFLSCADAPRQARLGVVLTPVQAVLLLRLLLCVAVMDL